MVNLLHSLHSEATRALVQHRNLLAGELRQQKPTTLSRSRPVVQRSTVAFAKSAKRAKYSQANSRPSRGQPLFIQVEPDGSDAWRLDAVVDALKSGSVSVIPTLSRAPPSWDYAVLSSLHQHPQLNMFHQCQHLLFRLAFSLLTPIQHWCVTSATEMRWRSCTLLKASLPKSNSAFYVGTSKTSAHTLLVFLPAMWLAK